VSSNTGQIGRPEGWKTVCEEVVEVDVIAVVWVVVVEGGVVEGPGVVVEVEGVVDPPVVVDVGPPGEFVVVGCDVGMVVTVKDVGDAVIVAVGIIEEARDTIR
jgi:hypothetical protein